MVGTDLCDYYDVEVGFKLFDIFGIRRLREATDRFDDLKFVKNQKIIGLERTIRKQCDMIKQFANENATLKKASEEMNAENARLTQEIERLKKKLSFTESSKISATNGLEKLSQENTELKIKLNEMSRNYNELADLHDEVCNCLRRGETDISLDKFYSRQAV